MNERARAGWRRKRPGLYWRKDGLAFVWSEVPAQWWWSMNSPDVYGGVAGRSDCARGAMRAADKELASYGEVEA